MRDSCQLFLFRYILISLLGNGRHEWPGVALLVSVLPSGFLDGLARHTVSLRRSLSCIAEQGACNYCPPFLTYDVVY